MSLQHHHLLLFPLCFARLSAGGESLLGDDSARYTRAAGGAVSAMPAAGSPSLVFNLRHRSVVRREKRSAGSHD